MPPKNSTVSAKGLEIRTILTTEDNDYLSLTDIAKYKNAEAPSDVIKNWLRLRNTIEYLGIWEQMHNPNFKVSDFGDFRNQAGANAFTLSPQKWIEEADIINIALFGCTAKQWRDAHPDAKGMPQGERLQSLRNIARYQLKAVSEAPSTKRLESDILPPSLPPAKK